MPSNSNNNNNNNEFKFVDETGKTKEKHKNQRRMALLNIHKTKLRKQLQNNSLLVNYFEWDHDACQTNNSGQLEQKQQNNIKRLQVVPNMYQYSLSNFTNENLPLVTKKQHVLEVKNTSIQQLNHHSKNKRTDSNSGNNNITLQTGKREEETKMKRKILISEEFGLKLDLEDFIQSLKEYGLH